MQQLMITVTGLTPAVVTETLWAVCQEDRSALPERIFLLTTADGRTRLAAELLGPDGTLARFCREFEIDPVIPVEIRAVTDDRGREIDDIRSRADSIAAADAIVHAVRDIVTTWPDATVHASLAGGRKTMSFDLGYAMTLFGKEDDRLTHVLVSPSRFEVRGFHYIPPDRGIIEIPDDKAPGGIRRLDTSEARIDLADIPFIRLRPHLTGEFKRNILESKARISHQDIVKGYQVSLAGIDRVTLDDAACLVEVRSGAECWPIEMAPRAYALYRLYAMARHEDRPGTGPGGIGPEHLGWISASAFVDTRRLGSGTSLIERYVNLVRRLVVRRESAADAAVVKQSAIQQDRTALEAVEEIITEAEETNLEAKSADSEVRHAGARNRQDVLNGRLTDLFSKERKKVNDRLKAELKHEAIYRHVEIAKAGQNRNGLRLDGSRIRIIALPD